MTCLCCWYGKPDAAPVPGVSVLGVWCAVVGRACAVVGGETAACGRSKLAWFGCAEAASAARHSRRSRRSGRRCVAASLV